MNIFLQYLFKKLVFIFVICGIVGLTVLTYSQEEQQTRFVFAGHIRGPENFRINSLLPVFSREIKGKGIDFVLIGGDTICGYTTAYDKKALNKEWDMVDEYLNRIGVPVYRVPGNHDYHSTLTKKVFNDRYGNEYFAFQHNDVLIIGLNAVKLCEDTSLDWDHIWHSNSPLPNIAQLPEGKQLEFLMDQLKNAKNNDLINHIVIFWGANVLLDQNIGEQWFKKIHPLLVENGKVRIVLSGEAGDDTKSFLEKNNIKYINSGWGINDEKDFSLTGTYLEVVFSSKDNPPEIYVRFLNLRPEYFQVFMNSISEDMERHVFDKIKVLKGDSISGLNKYRGVLRDFVNRNVRIYDKEWDVKVVLFSGLLLFVFILGLVFMIKSRKR